MPHLTTRRCDLGRCDVNGSRAACVSESVLVKLFDLQECSELFDRSVYLMARDEPVPKFPAVKPIALEVWLLRERDRGVTLRMWLTLPHVRGLMQDVLTAHVSPAVSEMDAQAKGRHYGLSEVTNSYSCAPG